MNIENLVQIEPSEGQPAVMIDGVVYAVGPVFSGGSADTTPSEITVVGNVVTITAGTISETVTRTIGTSVTETTYTPSTADQTIAVGSYIAGVQTIAGDANLIDSNIAAGKTIFGVAGTFTNDATATAEQLVAGATAWVQGELVTGTAEAVTLSRSGNVVSIAKGFTEGGSITVPSSGGELPEVTFTAADLRLNKTAIATDGSVITGTMADVTITETSEKVTISAGYNPTAREFTISGGSANISFGVVDENGKFQPLDGTDTPPTAVGNPITGEFYTFDTDRDAPSSGGGGEMDFYKCASVDTSAKTWTGYKAVFDAESEIWSFDAAVTTGLTFGENIVPAIGKTYNDTATIIAALCRGYPENALLINCDTLTDDRFTAPNCTLSTDIKKYGTGSIKINFNGYIKFDHGAESLTTVPWTVAHFFYADSYIDNDLAPLVNNDDDEEGTFFISISSDGTLRSNIRGVATDYEISEALSSGWHHLRVSHTGSGILRIYLDGTFIHSVSGFGKHTDSFWIGQLGYLDPNRQFEGYIDCIEFIPLDDTTIAEYVGDTAPVPVISSRGDQWVILNY